MNEIHHELTIIQRIAGELAARGPTTQVCEDTASVINGALFRLFKDSRSAVAYEIVRLCVRINRHCRKVDQIAPDEPFDPNWYADRLGILSLQLADQCAA
jgi:hypothetical protein